MTKRKRRKRRDLTTTNGLEDALALLNTVNDLRRVIRWLRRGGAYPAPESVDEACRARTVVRG